MNKEKINDKGKNNNTKIFIIIGIIIGVVLFFAFCLIFLKIIFKKVEKTTTIRCEMDTEKEYRDYWKYSLGDYRFHYYEGEGESSSSAFSRRMVYYKNYWFYYNDIDEEEYIIEIYNCDGAIEHEIFGNVKEYLEKKLKSIIESDDNLTYTNRVSTISVRYSKIDDNIAANDINKGVKFNQLSFNHLDENNLNIKIKIGVKIDYYDSDEIKDAIKNEYIEWGKKFLEKNDYNQITILMNFYNNSNGNDELQLSFNGASYEIKQINNEEK